MHKCLVVFGTRPEIIKLGPVYQALKRHKGCEVKTCWTGQHVELAEGLVDVFDMQIDFTCDDIVNRGGLTEKVGRMLEFMSQLLDGNAFDSIVVQGDTASAMAGAIAGFLTRTPVAHVEAGLRTHNLNSPWPEEFSRRVISVAGSMHYAPTEAARTNLRNEGIPARNIVVTGNTVVDAVQFVRRKINRGYNPQCKELINIPTDKKLILITGHRRENIGAPLLRVLDAIQQLAEDGDKYLVFPVHLNPKVKDAVTEHLGASQNILLVPPLLYPDFIYLLSRAWTAITDSGGIQEEAPSFKLPIIITRDSTERPEVIKAGFGKLVGSDTDQIVTWARMLSEGREPIRLPFGNPFGDGKASQRIVADLVGGRGPTHHGAMDAQISLI